MELNDIPKSLKIALALITVAVPLLTIVGNYAIYGYRIEALEIRLSNDERDSQERRDQLQVWEQQISTKVATTDTNVEWIRQEMLRRKN